MAIFKYLHLRCNISYFIAILILSLANSLSYGQDITDAVRYSYTDYGSSARYRALSGAFGALGGDFSAISDNPAGTAVFASHHSGVSLNYYHNGANTNYFETKSSNSSDNLTLRQAGAIFVFNNSNQKNLVQRVSFAVNYDRHTNFKNNMKVRGHSPEAIDKYFLYYADGKRLDLLKLRDNESISSLYRFLGNNNTYGAQQAFLGYQSYLISPESETDDNETYRSNIYSPNGVNQSFRLITGGELNKTTFSIAVRLKKRAYFGFNLNYHGLKYQRERRLTEDGYDTTSVIGQTYFRDKLDVLGAGFSFQLGAIFKLTSGLRLGLSYQSPVHYQIEEKAVQSLETFREDNNTNTRIDPQLPIFYEYSFTAPSHLSGSLAYLFKKKGLISFQYVYRDYTSGSLSPNNSDYNIIQNNIIDNILGESSSYRLGGEYNLKVWSFRAGTRLDSSPYTNKTNNNNNYYLGDLTGYSLGIGYKFPFSSIHLSYDTAIQDGRYQLYNDAYKQSFSYTNQQHNISLSVLFLF